MGGILPLGGRHNFALHYIYLARDFSEDESRLEHPGRMCMQKRSMTVHFSKMCRGRDTPLPTYLHHYRVLLYSVNTLPYSAELLTGTNVNV